MASLDDILTTQKQGVVAINNLYHYYINQNGTNSAKEITTTTLVQSGTGQVVRVAVIATSSTTGAVYDSNSTTALTGKKVYTIPATVGIYEVFMPCMNGIVVDPGAGQTISISYS